jgi:hypothetical protein
MAVRIDAAHPIYKAVKAVTRDVVSSRLVRFAASAEHRYNK